VLSGYFAGWHAYEVVPDAGTRTKDQVVPDASNHQTNGNRSVVKLELRLPGNLRQRGHVKVSVLGGRAGKVKKSCSVSKSPVFWSKDGVQERNRAAA